jgi:hypothetical protein
VTLVATESTATYWETGRAPRGAQNRVDVKERFVLNAGAIVGILSVAWQFVARGE